jgi:hypothetical protein
MLRDILSRMRHDGCGGRPGRVELLTGIEGASSRQRQPSDRKCALAGGSPG